MRVMTIVGTRPEIIRLSCTLPRFDSAFDHTLVHTGQNYDYELGRIFFDELDLRPPDRNLNVDTATLAGTLAGTLLGVEQAILDVKPHAVVILGDTNASIAAVIARRLQVPVYHLEAGNRSFDANVPEEVNRRLVDHVADFNLVYTEHARRNLLAEGLPPRRISLTGSPMPEVLARYAPAFENSGVLERLGIRSRQYFLVSIHREENVDEPERLSALIEAFASLQHQYDCAVLVSTHPRTRARLGDLALAKADSIQFHKPFGFIDFVALERNALCVLSDSGTISEEAAILGFPAVTLRDSIERPEALEAATILTTGVDKDTILSSVRQILARYDTAQPLPSSLYTLMDFSLRVTTFIQSTAHIHHVWAGVRRRSAVWS